MMMVKKWLVVVLLILLGIQTSEAIWCYICSSLNVRACGDDFNIPTNDRNNLMWCDAGTCVKRRGERVSGSVRRFEIQRSCVQRRPEGCYNEVNDNLDMYTCACNTDYCNTSSRLQYPNSIALLIWSVAMVWLSSTMRDWVL